MVFNFSVFMLKSARILSRTWGKAIVSLSSAGICVSRYFRVELLPTQTRSNVSTGFGMLISYFDVSSEVGSVKTDGLYFLAEAARYSLPAQI